MEAQGSTSSSGSSSCCRCWGGRQPLKAALSVEARRLLCWRPVQASLSKETLPARHLVLLLQLGSQRAQVPAAGNGLLEQQVLLVR